MSTDILVSRPSLARAIGAGILAGLAGGVVFGMLMGMMGMLPMVGMLVGQPNATAGVIVHLVISAGIGAVYAAALGILGRLPLNNRVAILSGLVNGVIWWVLGALTLMPLLLGMANMVWVVGQDQWMSLMGHLIYGVVTGLVLVPLSRRL